MDCVAPVTRCSFHCRCSSHHRVQLPSPGAAFIAGAASIACAAPITRCSFYHQVQLPLQVQFHHWVQLPLQVQLCTLCPSAGKGLNICSWATCICGAALQSVQAFSPNVMFQHFKCAHGKGCVPAFPCRTYRSRRATALIEAGLCGNSWPCTPRNTTILVNCSVNNHCEHKRLPQCYMRRFSKVKMLPIELK